MSKIFIIEGADGSGKTTLVEYLVNNIEKETGKKVLLVRAGRNKKIDAIHQMDKNSTTDTFLFFASMNDLLQNEIKNGIKNNYIIILERWSLSTFAYQFFSNEQEKNNMYLYNLIKNWTTKTIEIMKEYGADVELIYEYADAKVLEERKNTRKGNKEKFEISSEGLLDAYEKALEEYKKLGVKIEKVYSDEKVFNSVLKHISSNID